MLHMERTPEFLAAEAEWNRVFGLPLRAPIVPYRREQMIATNGCGLPSGKSFEAWSYRRSMTSLARRRLINRGEGGRSRVPVRCCWPLTACPGAPVCTARHIDGDALNAEREAA